MHLTATKSINQQMSKDLFLKVCFLLFIVYCALDAHRDFAKTTTFQYEKHSPYHIPTPKPNPTHILSLK